VRVDSTVKRLAFRQPRPTKWFRAGPWLRLRYFARL